MRFRMGVAVGFAAGYYLGAKAGRDRYEQMRRMIGQARGSRAFEKARAAVDLGMERIKPRETTIDITGVVVEELATR